MCRSPWISAALRYNQRGVGASTGSRQLRGGKDFLDVLDMVDHLSNELPPSSDNKVVVVGYSWGSCVAVHALKQPLADAYVGLSFPLGGLSAVLGTRSHFAMLAQTSHVPRLLIMGSQVRDCLLKGECCRWVCVIGVCHSSLVAYLAQSSFVRNHSASAPPNHQLLVSHNQVTCAPQDSFTGEAAIKQSVLSAPGGRLLRDDDSFMVEEQGASSDSPQPLSLRIWRNADHFWMDQRPEIARYIADWIRDWHEGTPVAS